MYYEFAWYSNAMHRYDYRKGKYLYNPIIFERQDDFLENIEQIIEAIVGEGLAS